MIKVNEISITNSTLTVDVYIDGLNSLGIQQINICQEGPDGAAQTIWSEEHRESPLREFSKEFKQTDLAVITKPLDENLFWVIIDTDPDDEHPEIPCNEKRITVPVFNKCIGVKRILSSMKELNNVCELPKNLINEILMLECADLACKIGCLGDALNLFKKFYQQTSSSTFTTNCRCNG